MIYTRLNTLYGDLSKGSYILDTEFFNELKNGILFYNRWTFYNDRVYVSYYNIGKPYIEERYYNDEGNYISNKVSIEYLINLYKLNIRKQKINKITDGTDV